jgi:Protein of unknown function (DUF3309)
MLRTILLIVAVLLVLGALPTWPYSSGWGYYPSGGLGLLLIILIVLVVAKRI